MFVPGITPTQVEDIPAFLQGELSKLQMAFEFLTAHSVTFLAVAPSRPREGMICGADGTHWNPGAGKGVYCYYSNNWYKLG